MSDRLRALVSPSLVVGIVAVVLVVAGGAVAASQITGGQIANSTITGKDVKNRSLTKADFRGSVRGPRGFQGPGGPQGPAGPTVVGAIASVETSKTVLAGDVDSVTVSCPSGQGIIGGAFRSVGADTEVFFSDSFGSPTTWAVGLDNFDSPIDATVTAVAFCAPRGAAVTPAGRDRARDRVAAAVAVQRASH